MIKYNQITSTNTIIAGRQTFKYTIYRIYQYCPTFSPPLDELKDYKLLDLFYSVQEYMITDPKFFYYTQYKKEPLWEKVRRSIMQAWKSTLNMLSLENS